ncbi:DEAD/DEAH box helicase [Halorubrum ezzemoulense]|uniref:DEAD/DEAH box helicase n=1 Tax=Halorubrum ezzemoulense TaxID=337243 RepID=UPI001FC919F7|nr:DEAD/DEAH box helicase [Halorubrum ezzemoulense]
MEFVDAPKFDDQPAAEFLADMGYSEELIETVVGELFSGAEDGSLYQHQVETIEAIERDDADNILAVPTATGKTESFFFPILEHCLSTDEPGLKSLIVYPMKTLGVDQLNRFISYLDQINQSRSPEDQITIGIWDSDTPTRVGTQNHEVEQGSYIRGLECPRSGEKLRVLGDMTIGTDDHQYSWVRVTRDAIRNGADILLTNPEALDYMFVSNNAETRAVLGDDPGRHPVKHIVFDEAHVWSGISGASIRLLTERLKAFYADRDPQVTMVSATVDNPDELAHRLTGTPESRINSIGFTGRAFPVRGQPDFSRFAPCTLAELAGVLGHASLHEVTPDELRDEGLENAYQTAREAGLVTSTAEGFVTIPPDQAWLNESIAAALDTAQGAAEFADAAAAVRSTEGHETLAESLLADGGLYSDWFEFVVDAVPEAAEFARWFDEDTTGEVGFKHYDALVEAVAVDDVANPEGALQTVMAFGRLAGMITEKYHVFLKPPSRAALCESCGELTRDKTCPSCGAQTAELQFCKRCHQPYIETDGDAENDSFRPFDHPAPVDDCPGCGQWPKLTDVGVPTTSLLSYMLTEVCRTTPSKKTLVFSDSHSAAESVGDRIIGTEYGLMAETLYVQELIERGGSADNYDLFRAVADRLRDEYWEPLLQNEMDEDGTAYNFLKELLDDIEGHAMLHNASHLIDSALMTPEAVADITDPERLIIAHETYKLFVTGSGASFSKNTISIDGLSFQKLIDRVAARSGYDHVVVRDVMPEVLERLLESSIIIEQTWEEVRRTINNANASDDQRDATFDYIEDARDELAAMDLGKESPESGILTRIPKQDQSTLVLLTQAAFCTDCYRSYPVPDDDAISACPDCGASIETYRRFTVEDGEIIADPGYANTSSEWPYALDHWAYDITTPIRDGGEPEFITVGIHKGNIPHTIRGAIEEGFRKDDPDVNIVSATPTMELGVDIGTLDTVSQVGIPPTLTNYVQRSGRTGRTRGSSSLVMTAIRGEHPVDGHYYGNLEAFLADFEPVRVPDPYRFDELLTSHVVTETFAYLARNPHPSNVFERMYELNETNQDLGAFVSEVEENLDILTDFLLAERRDEIEAHLESIFGAPGRAAFEQAFVGDGPLSVSHRIEQTFSRITALSGSTETNKAFTENNSRLDQWIARLGYLANYRSFGQQFPVKFTGRTDEIEFEGSGRLYDMFPGPENDLGAVVTLHGTDYIVSDVHGSATPLTTVQVCTNEECDRPFESYAQETTQCPYCEQALEETSIHGVSSVECEPARGGQKHYNTRGIMTTDVASERSTPAQEETTWSLFGLSCAASYGELEVTDFVYAFERRHSSSPDTNVLHSEALIERDASSSPATGQSWEERLEKADTEEYAPVGQQYHTQGITLRFEKAAMKARIEHLDHDPSWPQALVSLEQALEKAVSVAAQCDRSDFRVEAAIEGSEVVVRVIDSRQGGNGIAWQVWEGIDDVAAHVADVASCDRCADYCDECLLLSRTPGYYLENNLLNHRTLSALIGGNEN